MEQCQQGITERETASVVRGPARAGSHGFEKRGAGHGGHGLQASAGAWRIDAEDPVTPPCSWAMEGTGASGAAASSPYGAGDSDTGVAFLESIVGGCRRQGGGPERPRGWHRVGIAAFCGPAGIGKSR